ncbi:MAG: hypothetical protein ACOZCL_09635 [Bacillota bacterium]
MRASRTLKLKKKRNKIVTVLLVIFVIIPITAYSASLLITNIFSPQSSTGTDGLKSDASKEIFNNIFETNAMKLYRLDISRYDDYERAKDSVEALKARNLNAFVLKEKGFIVTFGAFGDLESAEAVRRFLLKYEVDSSITEVHIPAFKFGYNDEAENLTDKIREIENTLTDILYQKMYLCLYHIEENTDAAAKEEWNRKTEALLNMQGDLRRRVEELNTASSDNAPIDLAAYKAFHTNLQKYSLDYNSISGYFGFQNSILNQLEEIKRFRNEL